MSTGNGDSPRANGSHGNGGPGPLSGIKVIECSTWAFGPIAGHMLGDLGADVIKVENPNMPDAARGLALVAGVDVALPDGESSVFEIFNRNKRSIQIDLKQEQGQKILKELVKDADVFLENFRPGVFDRLGIGYEDLCKVNPKIIYGSTSGYGFKGVEGQRPALDPVGQARSGLMWSTGAQGDPPNWNTLGFADLMGGNMLAYGIVSALAARELQGVGQKVECSHMMASMWLESAAIASAWYQGDGDWARFERSEASNPLANHYACSDGEWLLLAMPDSNDGWASLCEALELGELIEDPRFAAPDRRREHAAALIALLDARFAQQPLAEWARRFGESSEIESQPLRRISDLPDDPAAQANGYFIDIGHPRYGSMPELLHPVAFGETPATIRRYAPQLGEHTWEVLSDDLGYDAARIANLTADGIVS